MKTPMKLRMFLAAAFVLYVPTGCHERFFLDDTDTGTIATTDVPIDTSIDTNTTTDSATVRATDNETESETAIDTDSGETADSETASISSDTDSAMTDAGVPPGVHLIGAPLIFSPTTSGFSVNAVLQQSEHRENIHMQVRVAGATMWQTVDNKRELGEDILEWTATELFAGTDYEYRLTTRFGIGKQTELFVGQATTAASTSSRFVFALITDPHIAAREYTLETMDSAALTLSAIAETIGVNPPDFLINLGDALDFHHFGFNSPPPDGSWTRAGYLSYRRFLGDLLGNTAHFMTIGNWEGETGCYTDEEIARSRDQRLLYMPGPEPNTYPEGGGDFEDYYAFTWGDAFFMVLNVMTYTPACHILSQNPGLPDDWTLGEAQMAWVEQTLENVNSKWRFVFIHHTVGGEAGDLINSAYGRGGGLAAQVGEQAHLHELMKTHGVQVMFYGHDHVFTDMTVDDIHYTLPGSAGAPWLFDTSTTGYPADTYIATSGYGLVEVSPDQVLVQFRGIEGDLLDAYILE